MRHQLRPFCNKLLWIPRMSRVKPIIHKNRRIRLMSLCPCCHLIQNMLRFIWRLQLCNFYTELIVWARMYKQNSNFPNESSRDLNWVAKGWKHVRRIRLLKIIFSLEKTFCENEPELLPPEVISYARGFIDILTFRVANKDSRTLGKSAYVIESVLYGCFVAVSRGKLFFN